MRRLASVLAVFSLLAMVSVVDADVRRTPINGTALPMVEIGDAHGFGMELSGAGGAEAIPANLYDNIPTALGGTGTPTTVPTVAFFDWVGSVASWGDDVHGAVPGIVNTIYYGYSNSVVTSTHTILFRTQTTPSASHPGGPGSPMGSIYASVVVPANPTGAFFVSVTGLSIPYFGDGWVAFNDLASAVPDSTFWMIGTIPGHGFSFSGVMYDYGAPSFGYFVPGQVFSYAGNSVIGLNMVPEPAAIGMLAIAGVLVLGWRRRK